MSRKRDLLVSCLDKLKYHKVPCSDDLIRTIQWVLAEPEEEGVYQKLLRIEKENYVEMLPSELWLDGYEAGKRSASLSKKPDQEPVAWCQLVDGKVQDLLTSFEMKDWLYDKSWIPLYTAPPKREPLSSIKILELTSKHEYAINLIRAVEKAHGIGGGE